MATEAIKSTAITNLDATPPVRTTDYGGKVQYFFASVATNGTATSPSTYQLGRLPSNAKLKSLKLWLDASVTTLTGDITLYYSDATGPALDGTNANAGAGVVTAHVYKTAVALAAVVTPTEYYQGGNITGTGLGKFLWQDAALASDPGGFFDIVLVTTATNSGAAQLNMIVEYITR